MKFERVLIVGARRSPIGNLCGSLAPLQAHQIGARTIAGVLESCGIDSAMVEETILGQVLSAGAGMNPARQAARAAGIPDSAPAMTINQVCGSGLRALALAAQQIELGAAGTIVAGGQESMSNAPHVAAIRSGRKLGDISLVDTLMRDGLSDAFYGYPMGNTAENIVEKYGISREQQDEFALSSQQKASAAQKAGRFDGEIVAITIEERRRKTLVGSDEFIRHDASAEFLAALRPAFAGDGSVTAGNSSGINDGAAALVLMDENQAGRQGLDPLARMVSFAHTGLDPRLMGLGPVSASRKALQVAGWDIDEVDLFEINEAFAAQSLAVIKDLGLDRKKVNVNGGAIALGHPIGASGARIMVSLVHELQRRDLRRGLASLCIGGGMGIAVCVENGSFSDG